MNTIEFKINTIEFKMNTIEFKIITTEFKMNTSQFNMTYITGVESSGLRSVNGSNINLSIKQNCQN